MFHCNDATINVVYALTYKIRFEKHSDKYSNLCMLMDATNVCNCDNKNVLYIFFVLSMLYGLRDSLWSMLCTIIY